MIFYLLYDEATGEVRQTGNALAPGWIPQQPGCAWLDAGDCRDATTLTHHVCDGKAVAYTPEQRQAKALRPTHGVATWCNTRMAWQDDRSLALMRSHKREEINAARQVADLGTFEFDGLQISRDEASQRAIAAVNGEVALTGSLPRGWPGGWKAVDNTLATINCLAHWEAFYSAFVAAGTANHQRAQELKAQCAEAGPEALALITW